MKRTSPVLHVLSIEMAHMIKGTHRQVTTATVTIREVHLPNASIKLELTTRLFFYDLPKHIEKVVSE